MLYLHWVMWSFYFPHEKNIYLHFDGMVYQQILEIQMGTNGPQLLYIYFSKNTLLPEKRIIHIKYFIYKPKLQIWHLKKICLC